jgi:hypothetical protein
LGRWTNGPTMVEAPATTQGVRLTDFGTSALEMRQRLSLLLAR